MQDPAAQMALMTAAMPQILRSQRLVGLAMAKGCTSLGGNSAAPAAKRPWALPRAKRSRSTLTARGEDSTMRALRPLTARLTRTATP